jgi:penicillin-binding protein 1A
MPIVMIPKDWEWTGKAHGDDLVKPGDIIYVHLDPGMEGTAHKATLEQDSGAEGSLMAVDNTSGDILAMVGGRDYSTSQFNRATQSERQVGSSFKPYVYTTAIEDGVKPTDIIVDAPVSFGSYTPHNYEGNFKGPMTVQNAFAESRNIPALKLAARVGIHKVIDTAHRFGVTSNIPAYLPIALGAVEITLQEQVASYSVFPNDGIRVAPRLIRKVENADGITLWEETPEVQQVTTQQTARTMMGMLKEVIRSGTGGVAKQLDHPLGGKTGTTSDFTDAWFLGFSPSVTCGVWVGYDSRQSLGDKETGAKAALPIWMTFMKQAIQGKDGETFPGDAAETALTAKAEAAKLTAAQSGSTATKISPGASGAATPARPVPQSGRLGPQTPAAKPPSTTLRPTSPTVHPALPNGTSTPPPRPVVKPAFPQ